MNHIDVCDCISAKNYKVTEIIAPLENQNSIGYLDSAKLELMVKRLNALKERIDELVERKIYSTN